MGQSDSKEERETKSSRHSNSASSGSYPRGEREVSRDGKHAHRPAPSGYSHAPVSLIPSSTASTSTSNAHALATNVSHSPGHGTARSITSTGPRSLQEDSASSQRSDRSRYMGQAESKNRQQRPPSRAQTLPSEKEKPAASPLSQPVDVPYATDGLNEKTDFEPSGIPAGSSWAPPPSSRYDRPPRLPLPIGVVEHSPGSPIISSADVVSSPVDPEGIDGALPRRLSVLSSTTADDEELDPNEFFGSEQPLQPTVPTTITWRGDADKIYVTGTFVNWERKFKLHADKEHGGFSATLQLRPGTHHLKFLVGGDMITSDDLPTTVDYTNILVNYIEVEAPLTQTAEQPPTSAEPMPIPGVALTAGQVTGTGEAAAKPMDIRTRPQAPETNNDIPSTLQETVAPGAPQPAESAQFAEPLPISTLQQRQPPESTSPPRQRLPRARYTNEIPAFLTDLDTNKSEPKQLQRAKRVERHLPRPPSLPMFLGKSILNGTTPHKDDASVLLMPNHTVLNHLATSSIKSGVLATSGTTRYKRKFLTTIMYKPTSDDG